MGVHGLRGGGGANVVGAVIVAAVDLLVIRLFFCFYVCSKLRG